MAPEVGLEPTTNRLTADRSTTELLRNGGERYRGVGWCQGRGWVVGHGAMSRAEAAVSLVAEAVVVSLVGEALDDVEAELGFDHVAELAGFEREERLFEG